MSTVPGESLNVPVRDFFLACQVIALIGCFVVFTTAVASRHAKQHATWYNLFISWIVSCLAYLMLLGAGQQAGPVSPRLCLTQASLLYGAPLLTNYTTLALIIQIWLNLKWTFCKPPSNAQRIRFGKICLLAFPWVVWVATIIMTLVISKFDPSMARLSSNGVSCTVQSSLPSWIAGAGVAVALLINLGVQINIYLILKNNWQEFRAIAPTSKLSLAVLIRLLIFTLWGVIAVCTSVAFLLMKNRVLTHIVLGIAPVWTVLVLGSQAEIIRAWMFWEKRYNLKVDAFRAEPWSPA